MSWWKIVGSDNTIGDEPADTMMMTLGSISQNHLSITIQELIDGFAQALAKAVTDKIVVTEKPFHELIVKGENNFTIRSGIETDPAEAEIIQSFLEGLKQIAGIYNDSWNRNPSIIEVLETLLFVIEKEIDSFKEVPDNQKINSITFQ